MSPERFMAPAVLLDREAIQELADLMRRAMKRRDDPLCEVVEAFVALAAACHELDEAQA